MPALVDLVHRPAGRLYRGSAGLEVDYRGGPPTQGPVRPGERPAVCPCEPGAASGTLVATSATEEPGMPAVQSLDELIARKAAEFADQVRKAAALADKEEEIRIAVENQLAFRKKEAGVELHGKQEFTVARGWVGPALWRGTRHSARRCRQG